MPLLFRFLTNFTRQIRSNSLRSLEKHFVYVSRNLNRKKANFFKSATKGSWQRNFLGGRLLPVQELTRLKKIWSFENRKVLRFWNRQSNRTIFEGTILDLHLHTYEAMKWSSGTEFYFERVKVNVLTRYISTYSTN